jgi:hypothetical protein
MLFLGLRGAHAAVAAQCARPVPTVQVGGGVYCQSVHLGHVTFSSATGVSEEFSCIMYENFDVLLARF